MQSPKDVYTRELHRKWGYFGTWHPGVQLRLGDVGHVRGNVFTRITTLEAKGVRFAVREDPSKDDLEFFSSGLVSIEFKASGQPGWAGCPIDIAKAGVGIQFGNRAGVVFQAKGCSTASIEDQEALGKAILELFQRGLWESDYAVVTELVRSDSGTAIVSSGQSGKLELQTDAKLGAAGFSLADASLNLAVVSQSNIQTKVIGAAGMTPMFGIKGIRPGLFQSAGFVRRGVADSGAALETEIRGALRFAEIPFMETPET